MFGGAFGGCFCFESGGVVIVIVDVVVCILSVCVCVFKLVSLSSHMLVSIQKPDSWIFIAFLASAIFNLSLFCRGIILLSFSQFIFVICFCMLFFQFLSCFLWGLSLEVSFWAT